VHVNCSPTLERNSTSWQYDIDSCGRVCRVQGLLQTSTLQISKRKVWQRVSAFGLLCEQFYEQSYQWVPVIPQALGGVNSPMNEILLKKSALCQYRVEFERCLCMQVPMYIDVAFDYGQDESNMVVGLQKPAIILLKLSDSELSCDDIEIIYN
jgi:hypothetical protein